MRKLPSLRNRPAAGRSIAMTSAAITAALIISGLTATAASAAVAPTEPTASSAVPSTIVRAAPVVGFDPGTIIDDALFFDGGAMSAAQIQTFLDQKNRCTNGRCLNSNSASISSRPAVVSHRTGRLVCNAVEGGTMPIPELIYRTQVACGISAKVILVTLEKEQSLVTGRAPTERNFNFAMGANCPDTAPCDPAYSGIGPQILAGVTSLKNYSAGAFQRQPGVHWIGFSPNANCGGTNVNVTNYATAALYNYTPYQPNASALAAGYGVGDGCGSYGNRNFYNFFKEWFGATRGNPSQDIDAEYRAQGGAASLGAAQTDVLPIRGNGGGFARAYERGSIYWNARTGAKTVRANILRDYYFSLGGADGPMGWPELNQDVFRANGSDGMAQVFTGGSLYASPRGVFLVKEPVRAAYFSRSGAAGPLGWPTIDQVCTSDVCRQNFEGGSVVSSGAGAFVIEAPVLAAYDLAGGYTGSWGAPVSSLTYVATNGGGYGQAFARGSAYYRSGGSAVFVSGAVRDFYFTTGGAAGKLGFPVGAQQCHGGQSCQQEFQFGWIIWSASAGARVGAPAIDAAFASSGGPSGSLGARTNTLLWYPYGGGGFAEVFDNGTIYFQTSASAAHVVQDPIRSAYFSRAGAAGSLGWPTIDQVCTGSVCRQNFEGGSVVSSGAGAFVVEAPVLAAYDLAGGYTGSWGAPVSAAGYIPSNDGGYGQAFAQGSAYYRSGKNAVFVSGAVRDFYFTWGGAAGKLGFPIGEQQCSGGSSCQQEFQFGWILWTPAGGARVGAPAIDAAYAAAGGLSGALGPRTNTFVWYPYGGGGFAEVFANGTIYYQASAPAAHVVKEPIRSAYFSRAGAAGSLGWPTNDQVCTGPVCTQSFEAGSLSAVP